MKKLDLLSAGLQGPNLIEASAGTGKTFTITGLYLRLVLEEGCRVERLLVVTFTNAATAELRARIRNRLVEALQAFEQGRSDDPFCQALLDRSQDHQQSQRRLRLAITGFDQAAIFTIHGFCQRVLSEHAFESGTPFEMELVSEENELLQEIAADFWRCRVQDLPSGLLDFLQTKRELTPEWLLSEVQKGIGRPFLEVRGRALSADLLQREAAFAQAFARAFEQVREIWMECREEIQALLRADTGLSRSRYPKKSLDAWFRDMDDYLDRLPAAPFKTFKKFTASELAISANKGKTPPEHPFFDACGRLAEAWDGASACRAQALVALKKELLDYCNRELPVRKERAGIRSFDDLLLALHGALSGREGGELIRTLQQRYSAILIDEFQDTDPIQYQIFSMIAHNSESPLFLVGDPKQAIYSFRGADIFAYRRARKDAKNHYTLETNWRSDPRLIDAVNALFMQRDSAFLYEWIPFRRVRAATAVQHALEDEEDAGAPFRIWLMPDEEKSLPWQEAEYLAAEATVTEIVRLLQRAQQGRIRIGTRRVNGGDIAVLVRSRRQGELVAHRLRERGVYSVQQSRENVFQTDEAKELRYVLRAIAEPAAEAAVMVALTTSLLGLDGDAIAHLRQDEQALERQLELFRGYHQCWLEKGFIQMFRRLLLDGSVAKRLLGRVDGERRFTNLQHLGELLHQYDRTARPGMEGLLKWLLRQSQNGSTTSEAQELRLESDEELVQILTIHKSKGLEYPIVFCPFLWREKIHRETPGKIYCFHDEQREDRPVLELGSAHMERDRALAIQEERAENLRLLYVALTRAKARCYITWGNTIKGAEKSALAWLLGADKNRPFTLERLLAEAEGAIWAGPIPEGERTAVVPCGHSDEPGSVKAFTRQFDRRRCVTSFSALTSGQMADQPDHDAQHAVPADAPARGSIFDFPRGARAGRCIHSIFERLDFSGYEREQLEQLTEEALLFNGFDAGWVTVIADMVESVVSTPLDHTTMLTLNRIPEDKRLIELEFHFPLSPMDARGLRSLLLEHGFAASETMRKAVEQIRFADVSGFMKGFIDLVFEVDGRFYLADYKSNWLGREPADYAGERLAHAMAQHAYYLQYLFYTLALHRYLALRLPGYCYERHFGGLFYLFVRGMHPTAGPACGVYRERPSRQLVEAMDRYLIAP